MFNYPLACKETLCHKKFADLMKTTPHYFDHVTQDYTLAI